MAVGRPLWPTPPGVDPLLARPGTYRARWQPARPDPSQITWTCLSPSARDRWPAVRCPRPEIDRTDGWHELQVANPSFLVEKLGAECGDLQGLREVTVNGIEDIAALGAGPGVRITWDLDWERAIRSDGRVRKLSVTDT